MDRGACTRTSVHARSSLSPRTGSTLMVMVPRGRCWWWLTTMFQGHPPFPPLPSLSSFAIADLHRETSDFTPTNLARAFFFSFFLSLHPFLDRDFFFPLVLADSRPVAAAIAPERRVNCTIFHPWKAAAARKEREKCRWCRNRGPVD